MGDAPRNLGAVFQQAEPKKKTPPPAWVIPFHNAPEFARHINLKKQVRVVIGAEKALSTVGERGTIFHNTSQVSGPGVNLTSCEVPKWPIQQWSRSLSSSLS